MISFKLKNTISNLVEYWFAERAAFCKGISESAAGLRRPQTIYPALNAERLSTSTNVSSRAGRPTTADYHVYILYT